MEGEGVGQSQDLEGIQFVIGLGVGRNSQTTFYDLVHLTKI